MSVFEQKMEEELDDFEIMENEEDRGETPKIVEKVENIKAIETTKKPETGKTEDKDQTEGKDCSKNNVPKSMSSSYMESLIDAFNQDEGSNTPTSFSTPAFASEPPIVITTHEKFNEMLGLRGKYLLEEPLPHKEDTERTGESEEETKAENLGELSTCEKLKKSIQEKLASFDNLTLSIRHTTLGNHEIVLTLDHLKKVFLILLPFLLMFGMIVSNWFANLLISSQLTEITKSIQSYCGCSINMGKAAATWQPHPLFYFVFLLFGLLDREDRQRLRNVWDVIFELIFAYFLFLSLRVNLYVLSLIV